MQNAQGSFETYVDGLGWVLIKWNIDHLGLFCYRSYVLKLDVSNDAKLKIEDAIKKHIVI